MFTIHRLMHYPGHWTVGRLYGPGLMLWTLERPWLDNRRYVSCIPCRPAGSTGTPRARCPAPFAASR